MPDDFPPEEEAARECTTERLTGPDLVSGSSETELGRATSRRRAQVAVGESHAALREAQVATRGDAARRAPPGMEPRADGSGCGAPGVLFVDPTPWASSPSVST